MIRYDKESTAKGMTRPRECAIPNRYLIKLPAEPVKGKPKRERLEVPDNAKLQKAAKASGALTMKKKK